MFIPPATGTQLSAGTVTLSVAFTPADATNYKSMTATVSLTVLPVTATITWSNPAAIPAGTPLSATQLNAAGSVPGSYTYSPAAGTVLGAGTYTLGVVFSPADATDYKGANASVSLTVLPAATTTLAWPTPAAITFGTPLSGTQLNAAAGVPGTYIYSPPAGTVLSAGYFRTRRHFHPRRYGDLQNQYNLGERPGAPGRSFDKLDQPGSDPVRDAALRITAERDGKRAGQFCVFAGRRRHVQRRRLHAQCGIHAVG